MEVSKIKETMRQKKITQLELSKKSNVPIQTIRYICTGRTQNPRIDTMEAIERALGITGGNSPLDNAMVGETLTEKEKRLLGAFKGLIEPMQDYIIEMVEKLAQVKEDEYRRET